jgi:hypothetical protein
MSQAKRMLEAQETRRQEAIKVCIAAEALRVCEYHGDIVMEGRQEVEDAYRVGNAKFTAGDFKGIFESRPDMTDAIKSAFEEHGLDECPRCAKLLED